ncbi:MAG: hypothetical protein IKK77_00800 [Clostridia bacterium]|nr:hypothetical protein [Clostridia bacterium]
MIKEEREFEINIAEILWAFWKRLWCIILAALILGGASYFYTKATAKPTYNAGAMLIINNKPDGRDYLSSDLINTSKELANTYTIIIKSRTVLDEVISDLNLDMSYDALAKAVSVSTVEETPVLKINVNHSDRATAIKIADKILAISPDVIVGAMDVGSVNVVETTSAPYDPYIPSAVKPAITFAFIGALLVCFVIVLIIILDNTYKSERDIIDDLGYPVLGVIPTLELSKTTVEKKSETTSVRGNL